MYINCIKKRKREKDEQNRALSFTFVMIGSTSRQPPNRTKTVGLAFWDSVRSAPKHKRTLHARMHSSNTKVKGE